MQTAMRKVFQCMDAGASHLDVLRPIKVSECAKSCFLSPATCTSLFRASREAILSQVVSKRVPPDAASFMHLYWAALALAPSRAIFPSLIELVDGLSNLAADASVRCHRSIPSITQTTLPALTEFALVRNTGRERSDTADLPRWLREFPLRQRSGRIIVVVVEGTSARRSRLSLSFVASYRPAPQLSLSLP